MIAAFGRAVVRAGGLDPDYGRILRLLFEGRSRADYDAEPVPSEQAEDAIAGAERFVVGVEEWLASRES